MAEQAVIRLEISAGGSVRVLSDTASGFERLGGAAQQSGANVAQAFGQVAAAVQQVQQAQARATQSAQQQLTVLQQQVAIQRQVIAGSLSTAAASRQMAEADIFARTGNRELAQQLAATRQQFEQNEHRIISLTAQGRTAGAVFTQLGQIFAGLTILGGVLAAVAAVKQLVTEGLRYNAVIEQQRIGIASIIAATNEIRSAQGGALEGAEKFAAAQRLSSDLMRQIQQDALQTTATTEQLVEAFQQALGPLSAAGLSLDQSRRATLLIVQAASALGVPMHQVAQEVRAIAEGSIDVNARLAKALGITNEQVTLAREQGRLFEFIVEQTQAFAEAGEQTAQSFFGLASSIADVSSQLAGIVFAAPFAALKETMEGVLAAMQGLKTAMDNISKTETVSEAITRINTELFNLQRHIEFVRDHPLVFEGVQDQVIARTTQRMTELQQRLQELTVEFKIQKDAADELTTATNQASAATAQFAEAQKKAAGAAREDIEEKKRNIAVLQKAIENGNTLKQAQDLILQSQIQWKTGSADLAQQLTVLTRTEDALTKTLKDQDDAQKKLTTEREREAQALARAQHALRQQHEVLTQQHALLRQIAAGTLDYAEGMIRVAAVTDAVKVKDDQLAEAVRRLAADNEFLKNSQKALLAAEQEWEKAIAQGQQRISDHIADLRQQTEEYQLQARELQRGIDLGLTYEQVQRTIARSIIDAKEASGEWTREQANVARATQTAKEHVEDLSDAFRNAGRDALLSTRDIEQAITGILQGTQDIGDVAEDLGQAMGVRLVKGILLGKGQDEQAILGNFNALLGVGAQGLFGSLGGNLGQSLIGGILGSIGQAGGIGAILGGLTGSAGGGAGGAIGSLLGSVGTFGSGLASIGVSLGTTIAQGLGIGISTALGIGGAVANLILPGVGFLAGFLLEELLGGLFASTPTRGTMIREGVKDWLQDIGTSFADEINTGRYFLKDTKALAKKLFGGDFLAASREILTREAGPEIAKQLLALGITINADVARGKKNLEQIGTTFGNLLVANLGIERIPEAIQEIVEKSGLNFVAVITKLNEVFKINAIGVDFYRDAIEGAVTLFTKDLPAGLNVAKVALRSFADDGIFSLEKFRENLELAATQTQTFAGAIDAGMAAALQAVKDGLSDQAAIAKGQEAFEQFFTQAVANAATAQAISEAVTSILEGIDLTEPIDLSSQAFLDLKDKAGQVYENVLNILEAAGLLPDVIGDTADAAGDLSDELDGARMHLINLTETMQGALRAGMDAVLNAIAEGIISTEAIARGRAAFTRFFEETLREAIISQAVTRFITDQVLSLFEGLDLTKPIDLGSAAFVGLADQAEQVWLNVLKILDAAGLLPEAIDKGTDSFDDMADAVNGIVDQIRNLNREIDTLQQKRLQIQLDLAADLNRIGALSDLELANLRRDTALGQLGQLGFSTPNPLAGLTDALMAALSDTQLEQSIALVNDLQQATIDRYNAELALIQQAEQAQIDAINRELAATIKSIHAEFEAKRQAIQQGLEQTLKGIEAEFEAKRQQVQAHIDALQQEKQRQQEVFRARLDQLQTELRLAQDFQRVAESLQQTINQLVTGPTSALRQPEQLAFLQRQAALLRRQIAGAAPEARPELIQQLAANLQSQLQVGQGILDPTRFAAFFQSIIGELETLQRAAAAEGAKAAQIQQRILDAQDAQTVALESIDAQIKSQQDLLQSLSEQEQAATQAARDAASAQLALLSQQEQAAITAAQAAAAEKIAAVQEATRIKVEQLRAETVAELQRLAELEDQLLQEQLRRLEEQKQVLTDQLIKLVDVEQATALLANPSVGLVFTANQINDSIGKMHQGIHDAIFDTFTVTKSQLDQLIFEMQKMNASVTPAQHGFTGLVTHPALFRVAERGSEFVNIRPARAAIGTQVTVSGERTEGKTEVKLDMSGITVNIHGTGYTADDARALLRALWPLVEQKASESLSRGALRVVAQKAARGLS